MYYTDSSLLRNYLSEKSAIFDDSPDYFSPFTAESSHTLAFSKNNYVADSATTADSLADSVSALTDSVRKDAISKREEFAALKNKLTDSSYDSYYAGLARAAEKNRQKCAAKIDSLKARLSAVNDALFSAPSEKLLVEKQKISSSLRYWEKRLKGTESLVPRARSCGSRFIFDVYQNKNSSDQLLRCVHGITCKNRLCIWCNARKARKESLKTLAQVASIRKNKMVSFGAKNNKKLMQIADLQCSFLTLTVPNHLVGESRDGYKRLRTALSRLLGNRKVHSPWKNKWIAQNILGALAAIEWFGDKTPQGETHLHAHVLLLHNGILAGNNKNYVESIFRREWQKCYEFDGVLQVDWQFSRDYDSVIKESMERGIVSKTDKFANVESAENKALLSMVLEVAKYSVTHATLKKMSADDIAELYLQSSGLRQFERYGVLYGFEFQDGESVDSMLAEVLTDYIVFNEVEWYLKAKLLFYYSAYKKDYCVEFIDDWGNKLKEAHELESSVAVENFAGEPDVPFIDVVPVFTAEKVYFEKNEVGSCGISYPFEIPFSAAPPNF